MTLADATTVATNANQGAGPAQVRRDIRRLCSEGSLTAAQLRLIQSGLAVEVEPGLWEYVARRAMAAGEEELAHAMRRTLWDKGQWSGDVALREAGYYLKRDDPTGACFVLEAVFGDLPTDRQARAVLVRSLLLQARVHGGDTWGRAERDRALGLVEGLGSTTPLEATTLIDVLRHAELFDKALEHNEAARARFPDDLRFVIRDARIREQLGQLDSAIESWQDVAKNSAQSRSNALFRILALYQRLGRGPQMRQTGAALALASLTIPERMRLALTFGQQEALHALVELAGISAQSGSRLTRQEGREIASILLDNGDIGLVGWLRRLRVPIGQEAIELLDAAGFGQEGAREIPQDFHAAARLRSPDFSLPIDQFLDHGVRPAGWPGKGRDPGRVLLVNATLAMGGAERQLVVLTRALVDSGLPPERLDVALFSLSVDRGHAHFLPDLEALGVTIHDLGTRLVPNRTLPRQSRIILQALPQPLKRDTTQLWHLVNDLKPGVLHGWQDRAALAAGIVGHALGTERIILSARNMAPPTRNATALARMRALYADLASRGNVTLTVNSAAGAEDYARWLGLPEASVPHLSNAVEAERFTPDLRQSWSEDAGRGVRLVGVFRLAANKRPQLWLRTLSVLRHRYGLSLQPRIFGTGPLQDEVRALAEELDLGDLRLSTGFSRPEDIYRAADAVLLMSVVEGTPNVLLEAQACGIPVAACDVGGVRDTVHTDGAGAGLILAPEITPEEAAATLVEWLPGALVAPMEDRVAFVRSRYSLEAFADRAGALYRGMVEDEA
jgi:glycosyltransferase involved in cell wall biosynthesis/tetratricopeptide (TPR) repeat protein